MRGNEIIISADPKGNFEEGILDEIAFPGMIVERVPATTMVGGRPHFRKSTRAAGTKGKNSILLPDSLQGMAVSGTTGIFPAYAAGKRCFVYTPAAGEEVNVLLKDVAGTADTVAVGDKLGVNNDGYVKRDAAYASTPFQAEEALAAATADQLVWCTYMGDQA